MRGRLVPATLIAVLALCGCGPKAITKGSHPFPAKKGVFADASGKVLSGLPDAGEPYRLVLLDFPWCPACREAWNSVREALEAAPPGTVRVYRILFDRETLIAASGKGDAAPIRPAPSPWPDSGQDEEGLKITTLTALPDAFREEFRVSQAPVLLLIGRDGIVERRWAGYSTNLREELSAALKGPAPLP